MIDLYRRSQHRFPDRQDRGLQYPVKALVEHQRAAYITGRTITDEESMSLAESQYRTFADGLFGLGSWDELSPFHQRAFAERMKIALRETGFRVDGPY